jgi:hypothetical protein
VPGPRIPAGVVRLQHLHPQVTARALGGITWTVSASAPSSPNKGDLWTNSASQFQLSQWTGAQWFAVPVNAGSLTGENFQIGATGQFHYASPPAFASWSFESGLQGWTAANAEVFPSPAWSAVGGYSALLTYTSGASWSFTSPMQTVQAGNQVYVSAQVNAPQALGAVGMQIAWYNSGGGLISTSSGSTAALAASTPTQLTYNAAPPSGAVSCQIIVQDAETSVTGYQLYVDDVYIAGQLAVATAPAGGSDRLGNVHPPGLFTAGPYGTGITMSTGHPLEAVPSNAGVTDTGSGSTLRLGAGLFGTRMSGGGAFGDFTSVIVLSSQQGSGGSAFGALTYTQGGTGDQTQSLAWDADGVSVNAPVSFPGGLVTGASSLTGGVIISQVDYGWTSQTNPTSYSRVCKVWDIPQGDPVWGTAYRLSAFGSGVWQGNALDFQIAAFGQQIAGLPVGGTFMSSGASFCWDLVAMLIISETGPTGILSGSIRLNMAQSGSNQLPNTGANAAGGFVATQAVEPVSGIGTAAASMTVQAQYGSSSSSQSILGIGSVFERIAASA